nr:MAG TPA: hypothetical protein [Caudoviricetes sp.]
MRKVYVQGGPIPLGRQGENQAQAVIWQDIAAQYAALYGEGTFQLMAQRCGDAAPYPVALTRDGGSLVWTVSDSDTAKSGVGRCELTYLVGGAVAKSKTWQTQVLVSFTVDGSAAPPDPVKSWVQEVLDAATAAGKSAEMAADSADKAESASVHAPQIGADGAWETWDQATGAYVSTGVEAQGPKGEDAPIVQSDWTQNDATAADYIKNRPGGYDVYSSELAATGSFAPESSEFGVAAVDFPVKFIVDGQKVTVKIENETFERTVQKVPDDKKINPNSLAEYWILPADVESIENIQWMFIFQLGSAGTWDKNTIASGTYCGKAFEVYAEVATPVKFPAKYVDTKFIVTATAGSDGTTCTADHTVAEVFAAYTAGKIVECHITVGQFTAILPLVWPSESIAGFGAALNVDKLGMGFNVNSITVFGINTGSNETWTMYTNLFCEKGDVRQVPEYSHADDDKFLRVVNGDPAWETVSDTTIKLRSSTAGSAKYFNITVNDSGQITATEAT